MRLNRYQGGKIDVSPCPFWGMIGEGGKWIKWRKGWMGVMEKGTKTIGFSCTFSVPKDIL